MASSSRFALAVFLIITFYEGFVIDFSFFQSVFLA